MVRRPVAVLGAAAATAVVSLVVAGGGSFTLLGPSHRAADPVQSTSTGSTPHFAPLRPGAAWLPAAGIALVAVLAAVLVMLVVFHLAGRREREPRWEWPDPVSDLPPDWGTPEPAAMLAEVQRRLAALDDGSPGEAIVACWVTLRDDATRHGVPPEAAETSREYAHRALGTFALDPRALETLAALYREARFSEHEMTEADRARARGALQALLAGLADQRLDRVRQ